MLGVCSFGLSWTDTSRGRMGTAADYDDAVFVVVVGLGLLRLGLARASWAESRTPGRRC